MGPYQGVLVVELIEALDRADECRNGSAVDAVCHRCWADVGLALEAVRNMYKAQALTGTPSRVPDFSPHNVV